jgi:hypothetical protein
MSALDHISPRVVAVALREGEPVAVSPIRMRQVGALARAVDAIWPQLLAISMDANGQPRTPVMADVLGLLAAHAEEMVDAVAVCTGMKPGQLEALYPDDFALLALACLEVNADFFAQAASRLKAAAPQIAPDMMARFGAQTNSPVSSAASSQETSPAQQASPEPSESSAAASMATSPPPLTA